jgi:sulfatase maturation enzyme AslB (radical SAM superfamily)
MTHRSKCAAFYSHTNVRGGNRVFPCCRFKRPIQTFDGDLSAVLHSKEYNDIRVRSETERLPECAKCWHEEDLGKKSLREWFNENYSTDRIELKYFEVGFDNICNLTCDGCWEEWSSSWWVKKNPTASAKSGITRVDKIEQVPQGIERVVFLGGEPLMTNRHRKFLESIDNLSVVDIEYYTNGMFSLKPSDHRVLKKCKSVKFTISIDGVGKLNEQVRSGSDWNTVINNTTEIAKRYNTVIHSVIHKNNWHGLLDLFKWVHQNSYTWTTNILTYPQELDIVNLDSDSKQQLIDLCKFNDIPNKAYIISHLQEK